MYDGPVDGEADIGAVRPLGCAPAMAHAVRLSLPYTPSPLNSLYAGLDLCRRRGPAHHGSDARRGAHVRGGSKS